MRRDAQLWATTAAIAVWQMARLARGLARGRSATGAVGAGAGAWHWDGTLNVASFRSKYPKVSVKLFGAAGLRLD